MSKRETAAIIVCLLVVGVVARLLPHLPNFAPITATALFSGAYMSRRLSLIVPATVMLVSDYLLLYVNPYGGSSFGHFYMPQALWHTTLPYVYASFAISAAVGWLFRTERSPFLLLGAALFCSLQFFAITNAGVWLAGAYDRGIAGLWESYVAGLPFFRGTVLGDLVYTLTFFGCFEAVRRFRNRTGNASAARSGAQAEAIASP